MMTNKFGEMVLTEDDLCDLVMQGQDVTQIPRVTVTPDIDLERLIGHVQGTTALLTWTGQETRDLSVLQFDLERQRTWFMPDSYKNIDIAKHVLDLCVTEEQLQRVGQELLLFQERDMLDLLRYLRYLVDVMKTNNVIWGVGRGSSVSSYVLYLLGVHRIDSLHYDLDIHEFLR